MICQCLYPCVHAKLLSTSMYVHTCTLRYVVYMHVYMCERFFVSVYVCICEHMYVYRCLHIFSVCMRTHVLRIYLRVEMHEAGLLVCADCLDKTSVEHASSIRYVRCPFAILASTTSRSRDSSCLHRLCLQLCSRSSSSQAFACR